MRQWHIRKESCGTLTLTVCGGALQEMRLLIFELRPLELAKVGLESAIRTRLDAVETRTGLKSTLNFTDDMQLSSPIESELYRIAQESLNNVPLCRNYVVCFRK
ncbi:MAG: hypothetical protein GY943_23280 [Chloroflexi bacterium]|nr:hypothetical protein [Chloroflexota bacterium]